MATYKPAEIATLLLIVVVFIYITYYTYSESSTLTKNQYYWIFVAMMAALLVAFIMTMGYHTRVMKRYMNKRK